MRLILRLRYVILGVATALVAVALCNWLIGSGNHGDIALERMAGRALFGWLPDYHGGALHLYALNSEIQIGPLPLAIMGLAARLPDWGAPALLDTLTVGCAVVCGWALERTAVNLGISARRAQATALGGGLAMLAAFTFVAMTSHLEDAMAVTGVLLAVAALAARKPWWVPALILGVAVSCKPWAIVAVPVLLHLDRDKVKALVVVAVVAFLPWAPFVIADPHTVTALGGDYNIVWPKSVLRVYGFGFGDDAPPAARTLALLVGVGLASLAALRGRWLAVPLAGFAGRMLLETHWFTYYGSLAVAGALLWDLSQKRRVPVWTLWTLGLEFVAQRWLIPWDSFAGPVVNFVFAVSVVVLLVLPRRVAEDEPVAEVRQSVTV